ncbi:hypothetical protein UlMin_024231 [Ulmus minor]
MAFLNIIPSIHNNTTIQNLISIISHLHLQLKTLTSFFKVAENCQVIVIPPEDHPSSPSIPPPLLPECFVSDSVKKKLPLMSYSSFLQQKTSNTKGNKCVCMVCLNCIEGREEVSVPLNCCHVFHKECLHAWIDQGHGTCPLCRSNLLLPPKQEDNDPWRKERMIFLFGEDYFFEDLLYG